MFLTRISVNQPVFATMVMVAIFVIGLFSYTRLPVEQLPDVDFPVVAVVTVGTPAACASRRALGRLSLESWGVA